MMNKYKYKRLWPRYVANMHALITEHPDTWRELEEGNISVTKSTIPFVGADHACEQLNRLMKVHGGLTGISNNPNPMQDSDSSWLLQNCVASQRKPSSCPPRPFPQQSQTTAWDHHQNQRSHWEPWESIWCWGQCHLQPHHACIHPRWACATDPQYGQHRTEVLWRLCVREDQWWCQSLSSCEKRKEPGVRGWQQEAHSQGSGQDCGSKKNERFAWALGPLSTLLKSITYWYSWSW